MISPIGLTLSLQLVLNLIHFFVFLRRQRNKAFPVSTLVRLVMVTPTALERWMNGIHLNIVLNHQCLETISSVHQRTLVFLICFIVSTILDVRIDQTTNIGVIDNINHRIVSINWILLVLMVNVSKDVIHVKDGEVVHLMKLYICMIIAVNIL
jgi:hypothetical protein